MMKTPHSVGYEQVRPDQSFYYKSNRRQISSMLAVDAVNLNYSSQFKDEAFTFSNSKIGNPDIKLEIQTNKRAPSAQNDYRSDTHFSESSMRLLMMARQNGTPLKDGSVYFPTNRLIKYELAAARLS